jgi:hypothetical protein
MFQEFDANREIELAAKRAQEDAEWAARYKEREQLRQQQMQEKLQSSPQSPSQPNRMQRSDLDRHAQSYDDDHDDDDDDDGYYDHGHDEEEVVDDFDEEPDMHLPPKTRLHNKGGTGRHSVETEYRVPADDGQQPAPVPSQSSSQQFSSSDPHGKQEAGLNQRDDADGVLLERSPIVQKLWMNQFGETEEDLDEYQDLDDENSHL